MWMAPLLRARITTDGNAAVFRMGVAGTAGFDSGVGDLNLPGCVNE